MNLFKKKQPSLCDISASFHPVADYRPSGVASAQKYHAQRLQNKKSFYRSCSSENTGGGMIVFPVGAVQEADIRAWLEFFAGGKWNIGRCFGGRYTTKTGEFSDCSVTVDLWEAPWQTVIETAEKLQKNFCPSDVLIKNFSTGAVWLAACMK